MKEPVASFTEVEDNSGDNLYEEAIVMSYRDPLDALRAENESLREQLKDAHEELSSAHGRQGYTVETDPNRWALGMRFLGGFAMMLPFLLMTAVCERRAVRSTAWVAHVGPARAALAQAGVASSPPPFVHSGCRLSAPAMGFERFTQSIERSSRVTSSRNHPSVAVGSTCTVRVAPVSLQEFNCHVEVVCQSGEVLYGTLPTGFAHCDVDGSRVLRAYDADFGTVDGDPALTVDLASGQVVVEDRTPTTVSRVSLALDTPR